MTFKFEGPLSVPRWTKAEFIKQKAAYVEKHGYTINFPGFEDIVKWDMVKEPSFEEMESFKKQDVAILGEKRYSEIKAIMDKKRENFMKLLSSPVPGILNNATSVLTALDDVNDTLGTFAFLASVTARLLPRAASKALLGPAGWALLGAELANLAMKLSTLPYKARRLQHELNDTAKGNPLSKKARVRRAARLRRMKPSPAVIIEGLQTTENMFGIGICLGPLMGLVWELPAGLARHVSGKEVKLSNLPPPLEYIEGVWSGCLKSASALWTGVIPLDDTELNKSMVAVNLASQVAHSYLAQVSPIDAMDIIHDIQITAPSPKRPSTIEVIRKEIGDPLKRVGWIHDNMIIGTAENIWHKIYDPVIENIANWRGRNKMDMEAFVAAQNQVDAGLNIMAALEGDDTLELDYEPFTRTMLKLMNLNYRFPEGTTQEQVQCFRKMVEDYTEAYGGIDQIEARQMSKGVCGFEFTTFVPARPTPTQEELDQKAKNTIERLKEWYIRKLLITQRVIVIQLWNRRCDLYADLLKHFQTRVDWLDYYGWPERGMEYWYNKMTPLEKKLNASLPLIPEFPEGEPRAFPLSFLQVCPGVPPGITRLKKREQE